MISEMPKTLKMYKKVNHVIAVFNFQFMKSPVELNSLLFMSPSLMRDTTGGLKYESNFLNSIIFFETIA